MFFAYKARHPGAALFKSALAPAVVAVIGWITARAAERAERATVS